MKNILAKLAPANKAFIAAILPVITVFIAQLTDALTVAAEGWVTTVIAALVTAVGVYETPNAEKAPDA